jgi:hypothetical protein
LTVASKRQIAANRRNARKSTGPRSSAGKRRTSRNSYRHGLTARLTLSTKRAKRIERLARKIAGDTTDVVLLEFARTAAEAEFDLARVRQVKVALIERLCVFGELDIPEVSTKTLIAHDRAYEQTGVIPPAIDAAATMPSSDPERLAEAVRRALPDLVKLDRYERRAAVIRAWSVRAIKSRTRQ